MSTVQKEVQIRLGIKAEGLAEPGKVVSAVQAMRNRINGINAEGERTGRGLIGDTSKELKGLGRLAKGIVAIEAVAAGIGTGVAVGGALGKLLFGPDGGNGSEQIDKIKEEMASLPLGIGSIFKSSNVIGEWLFGDAKDAAAITAGMDAVAARMKFQLDLVQATNKESAKLQAATSLAKNERARIGLSSEDSGVSRINEQILLRADAGKESIEAERQRINAEKAKSLEPIQKARAAAVQNRQSAAEKVNSNAYWFPQLDNSDAQAKLDRATQQVQMFDAQVAGIEKAAGDNLAKITKDTNEKIAAETGLNQEQIKQVRIDYANQTKAITESTVAEQLRLTGDFYAAEVKQAQDAGDRQIETEHATGDRKAALEKQTAVKIEGITAQHKQEIASMQASADVAQLQLEGRSLDASLKQVQANLDAKIAITAKGSKERQIAEQEAETARQQLLKDRGLSLAGQASGLKANALRAGGDILGADTESITQSYAQKIKESRSDAEKAALEAQRDLEIGQSENANAYTPKLASMTSLSNRFTGIASRFTGGADYAKASVEHLKALVDHAKRAADQLNIVAQKIQNGDLLVVQGGD